MRSAAETYGWDLDYGSIALMWRGGCIIRSAFLGKIKDAYDKDPKLTDLLMDEFFASEMKEALPGLRDTVAYGAKAGIPLPAFSSALAWFDGYTCKDLPANLLQAQRDYFGAHTYERIDQPRGQKYHTNWTGRGGNTSAGTYDA
jgi:6-phosphogluconate dehydrogenase